MKDRFYVGPFLVTRHKRGGKYSGRWLVNIPAKVTGKRTRKFFDTCKEAKQFAEPLYRKLQRGELVSHKNSSHSHVTFRQAKDRWIAFQERRVATLKKKPVSLETDKYRLKFVLAFFGDAELSTITEETLTAFQEHRLAKGKRPATINSDVVVIFKVLRWAKKQDMLPKMPEVEKVPCPASMWDLPSKEEMVQIIVALPKRLQTLARFLAETGCRCGEAYNLTWDRVDEINGVCSIRSSSGWTPKTASSERDVYIQGVLLDAIRKLPKKGKYVFSGKNLDKPINNFKKAFKTAVEKAKIEKGGRPAKFTPKSLRKAYATWLAMDGTPERVLQANLGHAPGSRVTGQYYIQAPEEERRKASISLPILRKPGASLGNNLATGRKHRNIRL